LYILLEHCYSNNNNVTYTTQIRTFISEMVFTGKKTQPTV